LHFAGNIVIGGRGLVEGLFSDESTFCQFGSFINFVRRPQGQRFNPKYTVSTVKHSPKVMVWGSFSARGRGTLYFVPPVTTVNSAAYLDILEQKLKLGMQMCGCSMFMQDSAPAHTAVVVKKWFHRNGIKILEWPGNSPDLNPIENLWMILKKKVRCHRPKNMQELVYFIKRSWCMEITAELCNKLVAPMPKRLQYVINNKVYPVKY
jgi:hypothetical protein